MVPLATLVSTSPGAGPDRIIHYNGFPSADISGGPAPGFSSGQAVAAMERIARAELPEGMTFEWTDLTYQEKTAGNAALYVFPIAVLLAFLLDRKSTRLNSSHYCASRTTSSACKTKHH